MSPGSAVNPSSENMPRSRSVTRDHSAPITHDNARQPRLACLRKWRRSRRTHSAPRWRRSAHDRHAITVPTALSWYPTLGPHRHGASTPTFCSATHDPPSRHTNDVTTRSTLNRSQALWDNVADSQPCLPWLGVPPHPTQRSSAVKPFVFR